MHHTGLFLLWKYVCVCLNIRKRRKNSVMNHHTTTIHFNSYHHFVSLYHVLTLFHFFTVELELPTYCPVGQVQLRCFFKKFRYNSHAINYTLLSVQFSGLIFHKVVQQSPLSNSRALSSPQ